MSSRWSATALANSSRSLALIWPCAAAAPSTRAASRLAYSSARAASMLASVWWSTTSSLPWYEELSTSNKASMILL